MRKLKFRAWDKSRKKIHSPKYIGRIQLTLSPDGRGFINVHGDSTKLSEYFTHLIPLQYTGLKDKNGKEIYEGDILERSWDFFTPYRTHRWGDEVGLVVFEQQGAAFIYKVLQGLNHDHKTDLWEVINDSKIIGNIYKNPKLLQRPISNEPYRKWKKKRKEVNND